MKAFKCDLCGDFYEPYNYYGNQTDEEPNSIAIMCNRAGGEHFYLDKFDACPKCMDSFKEFITQRKKGFRNDGN